MLSVVESKGFGIDQEGDFRNAVDNSGDFVGLVADWPAFACWWKFHPLVAGGSCDCAGNQSRDRPASRLKDSFRAKTQRKPAKKLSALRGFLCVFFFVRLCYQSAELNSV
jgi:hypothetical protein